MTTTNAERKFVPGDIISFCGGAYRVVKNYGSTGLVEYLDGSQQIQFCWVFEGEPCKLVEEVKL